METMELTALLSGNEYPGRGIVIGTDESGENMMVAYFIMGRSVNSRNRIFAPTDDGIITKAFDESKMVDPSLIIYAPVRTVEKSGRTDFIVTNGDQTDTIRSYLMKGSTFEDALRTRAFEPDEPNYTPRVSGLIHMEMGKAVYKLSILKSDNGNPCAPQRFFFDYVPCAGVGHFIHTYRCNGNPIPSFEGEPEKVAIRGTLDEFTSSVWESLNEDNKVSLYTAKISIATGKIETRIVNKNK